MDVIELDVFVLQTGELVVIHDILVDRTTNGTGYVGRYSFEDLRKLDAGKGQQVPTLGEVIELIDRRIPIMIELKAPDTGRPVAELLNAYLAKGWQPKDFEVISFIHQEVMIFRDTCPSVPIGLSLAGIPIDYCQFAKSAGANSVMLCTEFLSPEFIKDAHDNGITVNGYTWEPYTADTKHEIERIQATGIDGFASDRPDLARSHLKLAH